MEEKAIYMTSREQQILQDELDDLRINKRKEIAEKIKEAREQGDLSENAEYDAAKDEQRDIEARIKKLEETLKNSTLVDVDNISDETVNLGLIVKVLDVEFDEEIEYEIVGSSHSNSLEDKISSESPLGAAMMGKKAGDEIVVEAPAGVFRYRILGIRKPEEVDE
ncbi:MAG: transcription elongation factor GreA [Lachnospiraceae bacterium]|nr:transcription elongation factor GreA [Lachnospiraceae bacterium]